VTVDELAFTVRELGPAESHADSYVTLDAGGIPRATFIADLAFHGTHPFTADGQSGKWLAALDLLTGSLSGADVLYPGHGAPAGPELFAAQRRYLLYYREVVARLSGGRPQLTDAAKAELDAAMRAFLPGAALTWMIGLGADAVAAELSAAAAPGTAVA
jgi:glyoxylase-like metal-dependent hydrolase (beta-lactamase superfamily II)